MPFKETDLCRIAGFTDGEGSISLYSFTNHVRPLVTIVNKPLLYLEWIKEILNIQQATTLYHDKTNDVHQLRYAGYAALSFCVLLKDYLWLKKDAAYEIVDYYTDRFEDEKYFKQYAMRDFVGKYPISWNGWSFQ